MRRFLIGLCVLTVFLAGGSWYLFYRMKRHVYGDKEKIFSLSASRLPFRLSETSGLIVWRGKLWTMNDSGGENAIYSFPPNRTGEIRAVYLDGCWNHDWEEISQDSDFVYVGDFGNNATGNRKDLNIIKVSKASLLAGKPEIRKIYFSYGRQKDFSRKKENSTDFDCEAMVVDGDSIYLFTKQWLSNGTDLYTLPNRQGRYIATYKGSFFTRGLVTGAYFNKKKNILALCGYTRSFFHPFIYMFYKFRGDDFFSAGKRKFIIPNLKFHQVEGIASSDGIRYYISNEQRLLMLTPAQLHTLDFSVFFNKIGIH